MILILERSSLKKRTDHLRTVVVNNTIWMAIVAVLVSGCAGRGGKEQTIKNYRLYKPQKFNIPSCNTCIMQAGDTITQTSLGC